MKHIGCLGDNCPICPKLDLPGYERVRAHLTGQPVKAKARPPLAPLVRPIQRNLLYHIYAPRSSGGTWRWNICQLRARLSLFDGKRIVAIAHGPDTEPPSAVRHELDQAGLPIEYVEVKNNPNRREVETFLPLFDRVKDAPGVTLYAHAKGVTRPASSTAHDWSSLSYSAYLDYWPVTLELLDRYPVVGAFKRHNRGWKESESTWHYSGSWTWFRNDAHFNKSDWRRIDQFWSGIEPYFSLHHRAEEAGCIFHEFHGDGDGLYNRNTMDLILAKWEQWKLQHADQQTEWPT